jgi:hypothetical protein
MFRDVKTVEVSADKKGISMDRGARILLITKPVSYKFLRLMLCVCVCVRVRRPVDRVCINNTDKPYRDCRWLQALLRKIGPSCVRHLIAELEAGVMPLPLYSFNYPCTHITACGFVFMTAVLVSKRLAILEIE